MRTQTKGKRHSYEHLQADIDQVRLDFEMWWLILHIRRAMFRARADDLRKYKITPEEAGLIFTLKAIGHEPTPTEISRWLIRRPHTITGLVNRMLKKGLVGKRHDLKRKNLVRVSLTEMGEEAYKQAIKPGSINEILSCYSKEQYWQLRELLEILRDASLKHVGIKSKPPYPPSRTSGESDYEQTKNTLR